MRVILLALLFAGQALAQIWPFPGPGVSGSASGGGLVTDGLLNYYEPALGDEGSPTLITDKSAYGEDLTITGASFVADEGVAFDGVNDYARDLTLSTYPSGPTATAIWVLKAASAETSCVLAGKTPTSTITLELNSSGLLVTTYMSAAGYTKSITGGTDERGAYIFVTSTIEVGSQLMRLNGLTAHGSGSFSSTEGQFSGSAQKHFMGAGSETGPFCECTIAASYAFDRKLADAEIEQMYAYVQGTFPSAVTTDLP